MKMYRVFFILAAVCALKIVIGHEEFDTKFYLALASLGLFISGALAHLAQDRQGQIIVAGLMIWKFAAFIPLTLFLLYMTVTHW